ncbi:hypothetical protein DN069_36770 [Streptacidiphilus pinicola]|uniref:Sensor domain-containing protein n=1 Tax=Streptacidiphilus pinicola TaxID=2219663 RepID=A0A2X0K056_9ACTN|nr:hypothetical protein [Streptacidiphilus pinicola]RAG80700.1 hypothetical protein DN069_36770 [Streptacidiphilus pinicola]
MRARAVVAVLVAAAVLGVLTGRFVLPAPSPAPTAPTAPTAAPSRSVTGSKPATGPVTERNLLAATAFAGVGVTGHLYVRDRFGDGVYANAACAGEKTLGQTLGGPGAHFRGLMTSPAASADDTTVAVGHSAQVAREVAADAGTPALAQNFAERLVLEEVPCQDEPPGHWVYGPTHTLDLTPDVSASWMGIYQGDLNTTGTAPAGREPCGGISFLRSGSHYAILEVDACLGTEAMTALVRTAVSQL